MKSSKRVLSMLMTLVFVFTSVFTFSATIAGAANFTDVSSANPFSEAITELVDRGVINGYEDGSFKPDNTITRAEFSKLLATASAPSGTTFPATTTQFPDVADSSSPSAWAIPYISYAVGIKAINGYDDGTFRPTNPVTYGEAVKMIVCTLGYDPVVDKTLTPWYQGYIDVANQIKLTQNAISSGDSPASRALVAQLVYNMLGCSPLIQTGVDLNGNPVFSNQGSSSFDEQKDNATQEEGILLGLIDYTLTGDNIKKTQVQIGREVYDMGSYTIDDLKPLIGRMVVYKYNAKDVITSIKEASGYNETVKVEADMIANVTDSYVSYYKNEKAEYNEEDTTISMPNVYVIYNGVPVPRGDIGAGFDLSTELNIEDGSITFLSNDSNPKTAEVVFVESYKTYFANTPSRSDDITTIYDQYPSQSGNASAIVLDADEVLSVKKVGTKGGSLNNAELKTIVKNNVVSVAYPYNYDPASNGTNVSVIYSTATVSGEVTEMNDDYSYIKIGSAEYELSPYFEKLLDGGVDVGFGANDSGKFYLDRLGRIVFFQKNESSNPYALAVRYNSTSSGFESKYGIDLYISGTGGTTFYQLKDSVKVNGDSMEPQDVITHLISTCPTYAENAHIGDGKYILQPIKYALSTNSQTGEKEISAIECMDSGNEYFDGAVVPYAIKNTVNNISDVFANGGKLAHTKSGYSFKQDSAVQFSLNSSSVVFAIPQDITNVKAYRKYGYNSFSEGSQYCIEPYDVEKGVAKVSLYYLQAGQSTLAQVNASTPVYFVHEITDAYNKNNQPVKKISYYKAGTAQSEPLSYLTSADVPVDLSGIDSGDAIKFALTDGDITVVKKVYDASEGTLFTETGDRVDGNSRHIQKSSDGKADYYQAIEGIVYTVSDSPATISIIPHDIESLSDGSISHEERVSLTLSDTAIFYKYESAQGRFRTMDSAGEILTYEQYAATDMTQSSKVLAIVMDRKVIAVYILN